jgi:hypothetical protein
MNILDILTAISPIVLTTVATYIVIKQYLLERKKTKFEHFDKRYNIYKRVMEYIANIVGNATTSVKEMVDYRRDTSDAMIFFNHDVIAFIESIYDKANRLRFVSNQISRGKLTGDVHANFVTEEHDLLTWFGNQFTVSQELFIKYLKIDL